MKAQTLTMKARIENLSDSDALVLGLLGYSATKLWNTANWYRREEWASTGRIPSYPDQAKKLKTNGWYRCLHSQSAQAVLEELERSYRSWYAKRKHDSKARPPGFRKRDRLSTLTFKKSAIRIEGYTLRVAIPKKVYGRQFLSLQLRFPPGRKVEKPQIVRIVEENGNWYAHIIHDVPCPQVVEEGHVMGVDLGEKVLAACAATDGCASIYPGGELRALDRYFSKESAKCHSTKSRKNRDLKRRWSRKRNYMLHVISKAIVCDAQARGVSHIVLGHPKGVRNDMQWGKKNNRRMHAWPYAKLISMISYKAALRGITVVTIDERGTSSKCCLCHYRDKKGRTTRGWWSCPRCGASMQADINGAVNILNEYLHEEGRTFPSLWSSGCLAHPAINRFAWGDPRPYDHEAGTVRQAA